MHGIFSIEEVGVGHHQTFLNVAESEHPKLLTPAVLEIEHQEEDLAPCK